MILPNPGITHSSIDADEYNGYYIPKGTIIFGNTWFVHFLH